MTSISFVGKLTHCLFAASVGVLGPSVHAGGPASFTEVNGSGSASASIFTPDQVYVGDYFDSALVNLVVDSAGGQTGGGLVDEATGQLVASSGASILAELSFKGDTAVISVNASATAWMAEGYIGSVEASFYLSFDDDGLILSIDVPMTYDISGGNFNLASVSGHITSDAVLLPGTYSITGGVDAWVGAPGIDSDDATCEIILQPYSNSLYVDDDAPDGGDGTSWSSAYRYLQDALFFIDTDNNDIVTEVRIGQGIYRPTARLGALYFPNSQGVAVAYQGGYAGLAGPDPDARDITQYNTVLSGDVNGDDGPPGTFLNYDDNYTVITSEFDHTFYTHPIFDGLTITSGYTTGDGGGSSSAPTFVNCTFQYNYAAARGGALSGAANVTQCTFVGNVAGDDGGAVYVLNGGHHFIDCFFMDNSASDAGGAVYTSATFNSIPETFLRCLFIDNSAQHGGACYNAQNVDFIGCTFSGNQSSHDGGALSNTSDRVYQLYNCKLIGNTAGDDAGALLNSNSSTTFVSCLIAANTTPDLGGGILNYGSSTVTMINCTVTENSTSTPDGAGLSQVEGSTSVLSNCIFSNNEGSAGQTQAAQIAIVTGPPNVQYSSIEGWDGSFGGIGNSGTDPLLVHDIGDDGLTFTADDEFPVDVGSPCIDAADTTVIPTAILQYGVNGIYYKSVPNDLLGNPRVVDDPSTPDSGVPNAEGDTADIGAYEFQPYSNPADITGDGIIGPADLAEVLAQWGVCEAQRPCTADIVPLRGDRVVGPADLAELLANWGM